MSRVEITHPELITEIIGNDDKIIYACNDGLYEFLFSGESIRINYSGHPSGMISQLVHNVVSLFIFKKGGRVDMQLDVLL